MSLLISFRVMVSLPAPPSMLKVKSSRATTRLRLATTPPSRSTTILSLPAPAAYTKLAMEPVPKKFTPSPVVVVSFGLDWVLNQVAVLWRWASAHFSGEGQVAHHGGGVDQANIGEAVGVVLSSGTRQGGIDAGAVASWW